MRPTRGIYKHIFYLYFGRLIYYITVWLLGELTVCWAQPIESVANRSPFAAPSFPDRKRYPYTAALTELSGYGLHAESGFEPATFCTIIQRL